MPKLLAKKKTKNTKTILKKEINENWFSAQVIITLSIMFTSVQILGIYVAKQLISFGLSQPMFGTDINDVTSAIYLFISIMISTAIILILIKFRRTKKLLLLFEAMAIFSTCTIVLTTIFPTNDLLVLLVALAILAWRYTHRQSVLFRDFVSLIAVAGAGAYIGISFGLIPILAFIIILAIYDIIAVFYTKHMVEIGKQSVGNNYAFTIAIPTKKHTFELGNGDLVIPLAVASSIIANGPFMNNGLIAGLCLTASFVGLLASIYTVSIKKIPLPALPPQTALIIIVLLIGIFLKL